MKASFIPLAVVLTVGGVALADDGDAPKDQPAKFKVTTKRKDDAVEVQSDKDRTVFDVKSPFGISQAVIEREGDDWPKAVVLRLHLKGLEGFRAENGKVTADAAVSTQDGKARVRVWKDGKEDAPLDEKVLSGRTSASWAATASRVTRFRSRTVTSRSRCRRRSSGTTRIRSR